MLQWTFDMVDAKMLDTELASEDVSLIKEISEVRRKGNFQTMQRKIGLKRVKQLLKNLYPKYTITEIEKIVGVPDSTLERWFQQLEIPFIRHRIGNRSFAGDEDKTEIDEKDGALYKKNTVKITPELAYVIGFTLGDGAVQRYMIEVFNKDENLHDTLYRFLQLHGTITEDRRPNGLWRLRLSSVLIADLIKNKKEMRKDTVDYILQKDELAKKFIAAFWDAEGSVLKQKNYYHVYLWNSNKYLLDNIGLFLASKGIEHSIINIKQGPERNYSFNGRRIISRKKLFRSGIPKKAVQKWANEIGIHLLHTKKSKMVEEIFKAKEASPK